MDVVLIAAISLDGCITRHDDAGTEWTSRADQEHFRSELRSCDAHVFGSATYDVERPRLRPGLSSERRRIVMTRRPAAYAADEVPGALEFSDAAPAAIVERLRDDGCRRVAVLGGSVVYRAFLDAGLLTEAVITVEPRCFGRGTRLGGTDVAFDAHLALDAVERIGTDSVVLRYRAPNQEG